MEQTAEVPRFRSWLKLGVEAFSLLASLAFLGAVAVNEYLFRQWGLTFLQVASPADVIMTGLGGLFSMSPLVVFAGGGAVLGLLSRRVRWLWWGLLLVECAVVALLIALFALEQQVEQGVIRSLILSAAPIAHSLTHARSRKVLSRRAPRVVLAALVAGSVLGMIADQLQTKFVNGVTPRRVHLVQPKIAGCHGLVLWQGERATVLDCGYSEKRRDPSVLYNPQHLLVTTGPVPHPQPPRREQSGSAR